MLAHLPVSASACLIPTGFWILTCSFMYPPAPPLRQKWPCTQLSFQDQPQIWVVIPVTPFLHQASGPCLVQAKLLPSFQPWAYHLSFLNHLKPPHHLCIVNTWWQIVTVVQFEEKRKGNCIKVALSVWKSSIKLMWILDISPLCREWRGAFDVL